jgi:hypothetical protein
MQEVSKRERTARHAAAAVSTVLALDGLLHLYWAMGATWPARDRLGLSLDVLGMDVPFAPRDLLPLATLLLTGAGIVQARVRLGRGHRWGRVLQAGTTAVAAGVSARAAAGLVWMCGIEAGLDERAGATFQWLNACLYTPLSLVTAAGAILVVRSGRTSSTAAPAERMEDCSRAR